MFFCFQGPRGTARLMFAISTRHCTVFKVLSVLHDIDSLSFCCVFRQRDKGKRANRSRTESNNLPNPDYCALTTTAAATAADSSRHRGYKAATAAETYHAADAQQNDPSR